MLVVRREVRRPRRKGVEGRGMKRPDSVVGRVRENESGGGDKEATVTGRGSSWCRKIRTSGRLGALVG